MRQKIVAANWKMNIPEGGIHTYFAALRHITPSPKVQTIWCVPAPYLTMSQEQQKRTNSCIAAQNMYSEPQGAFTGEVSAAMLQDLNIPCVLIGHSERRTWFQEGNELLEKKCLQAINSKLQIIYCIGETLEERKSEATWEVLRKQLHFLKRLPELHPQSFCIAYEPVWAIGTGLSATPTQAEEAHLFIREEVAKECSSQLAKAMPILYGGSVSPDNVSSLAQYEDIDGVLVGGASLVAEKFSKIMMAWG
ncbi:MAG: triose-phosphate isomerase [Zetaproteobacteria bacterium]|nr:triose-phosphate isomerase [Zetaproteobacteria bacterium]